MSNRYFRFGNYELVQDPSVQPEFRAMCISTPQECTEHSGPYVEMESMHKWCVQHTIATGHEGFRRTCGDEFRVISPEGALINGKPYKRE